MAGQVIVYHYKIQDCTSGSFTEPRTRSSYKLRFESEIPAQSRPATKRPYKHYVGSNPIGPLAGIVAKWLGI